MSREGSPCQCCCADGETPSACLMESGLAPARQLFMAHAPAWGGLWWLGIVGACKGTACHPHPQHPS